MNNQKRDEHVIIQTKIICPPVKEVVRRDRLYDLLDEGKHRKLSIISAPAGYGKTTLVASWIVSRNLNCKWITLDRFDTSVNQLASYLYLLFEKQTAGLTGDELTIITKVLNRLSLIHEEIILVLDDYHLAESAEIRDLTSLLIEYSPHNFHIVIITRVDPQLKISRLRGQRELLELKESDLRFTMIETSQFFTQITPLSLDSQQIATIVESTEGWVAGLQIIASSMTEGDASKDISQQLKWNNRYLLDYLVEEVLTDVDPQVKEFLLKISILERLNADVCNAVTHRNDSQQILEYLEHHNLFLSPLDNEHRWYRLHNLFSDLLFSRCVNQYGDQLKSFYEKAADWSICHEHYVDAIDYMFKAQDGQAAAKLIDRYAFEILKQGNIKSLMKWTMELPDSLCKEHAITMFFHAWIEINEGRSDFRTDLLLDDIERRFPSSPFCMLRSYIAMLRGNSQKALQIAIKAKDTLSSPYSFIGGIINFTTALAQISNNEIKEALSLLRETFERALSDGNTLIAVMSLDYRARVFVHKGDLDRAETLYKRASRLSTDTIGAYRWLAGSSLTGIGEICRLRGDYELAEQYFHKGLSVSANWVDFQNINAHIGLAQIWAFKQREQEAFEEIDEAQRLAKRLSVTLFDDRLVEYYHNLLLLRFGYIEEVSSHAFPSFGVDSLSHNISYLELYTSFCELLLAARLSLAQHNYEESISLAKAIDELALQLTWPIQSLEARLILIQSYWNMEESPLYEPLLHEALKFSALHQIIQLWVDEGEPMKEILQSMSSFENNKSFVRHLLSCFYQSEGSNADKLLSSRELEVLSLCAQGLTNKEIASQLCLSERTIKWHSSNIYHKLNVKNRAQAINAARQLHLI